MTKRIERVYTEKQQAFLAALQGHAKGDMRKAMDYAGYSEHAKPHELYRSLSEEIKTIGEELLAANIVKAVHGMIDVMDSPAQMGANNKLAAAKELLDRVGVVKKEANPVQIHAQNIFLLPPKDGIDTKTIDGYVNDVKEQLDQVDLTLDHIKAQSNPVQIELDFGDD